MAKYRYVKFQVDKKRGSGSGMQLSCVRFLDKDGNLFVYPASTTVTPSSGNWPSYESPANLKDNKTSTKWCNTAYKAGVYVVFDMGEGDGIDISVYSTWQWYTANDATERDPVSFSISVSNDNVNYIELDKVTDAPVTGSRYALAYSGTLVSPYASGYLLGDKGKFYTVTDGELSEIPVQELTADVFLEYAFEDLPESSILLQLEKPEVYFWEDSDDAIPVLAAYVTGLPFPQVFETEDIDMSDDTILGISYVDADIDDKTLMSVSFDSGQTWLKHDGEGWVSCEASEGMTKSEIRAVTQWDEVAVTGRYRYRFYMYDGNSFVKKILTKYRNEEAV